MNKNENNETICLIIEKIQKNLITKDKFFYKFYKIFLKKMKEFEKIVEFSDYFKTKLKCSL